MNRSNVFDVTREGPKWMDRYGRHEFGQHCLLARRLLEAGVTFVPGTDFFADGSGGNSLRLAFSFVSPEEIATGVERLARVSAGAPAATSTL